jgi:type IV secretory pathway TraG/TraD family ATPase VirD4
MLPQELKQMGALNSIIILEDCPPIKATKIRYYESEFFMKRLLPKINISERLLKQEWRGMAQKIDIKNHKKILDENLVLIDQEIDQLNSMESSKLQLISKELGL